MVTARHSWRRGGGEPLLADALGRGLAHPCGCFVFSAFFDSFAACFDSFAACFADCFAPCLSVAAVPLALVVSACCPAAASPTDDDSGVGGAEVSCASDEGRCSLPAGTF